MIETAKKHTYSLMFTNGTYNGYTLLELLVVMAISMILIGMSFASFGGLQDTIKMNEYTLTLEQNITSVQRAAMLLEKKADENWLYGLGIDFSKTDSDGLYQTFKWCSPFWDYGDTTTKSYIPSFNPSVDLGVALNFGKNGYIPLPSTSSYLQTTCDRNAVKSSLVGLIGYKNSLTPPQSKITTNLNPINNRPIKFVVFESVSGRAFFYDDTGRIVNYDNKGKLLTNQVVDMKITIDPDSSIPAKEVTIGNLSGRVSTLTK